MEIVIVGAFIGAVVFGVLTNSVAASKGRSAVWFWIGFFFGPIGLIAAAGMSGTRQNEPQTVILFNLSPRRNLEIIRTTSGSLAARLEGGSVVTLLSAEEAAAVEVLGGDLSQEILTAIYNRAGGRSSG